MNIDWLWRRPPLKHAASQQSLAVNNGLTGPRGPVGPGGQAGSPDAANQTNAQAPSNQRFNSFCERFVIERCKAWPQENLPEAAWRAIQDAKTVYHMIQGVSSKVKDR